MSDIRPSSLTEKIAPTTDTYVPVDNATEGLKKYNLVRDVAVANGTYDGQNLMTVLGASSFSDLCSKLHARAQAKNGAGMRIGDWMDITPTSNVTNKGNAMRARLAGIGHNHNFGDSPCPWAFWFVIDVPIDMTNSAYAVNTNYIYWNTTATNNGTAEQPAPYLASNLHAWEIGEFLNSLPTALTDVLVSHRIMFEQRYSSNGALTNSTGWGWGDAGKIFSLSETEVYGQCVWGTNGFSVGCDAQLPLFRNSRERLRGGRNHWWLRSVRLGSSSDVCDVNGRGNAGFYSATDTGIRPRPGFLVG